MLTLIGFNYEIINVFFAVKVDDVMTQIMGFFVGGFETTSSGLAFCLYELSRNPDIQVRARREVDKAYERHGSVTYRMLQELTYLDNVISGMLSDLQTCPWLLGVHTWWRAENFKVLLKSNFYYKIFLYVFL